MLNQVKWINSVRELLKTHSNCTEEELFKNVTTGEDLIRKTSQDIQMTIITRRVIVRLKKLIHFMIEWEDKAQIALKSK